MQSPSIVPRTDPVSGKPRDWTATQCAAYRGVSRQQWLADVREGLEPAARAGTLWSASAVRAWKRPDEWFAGECGAHHGCTAAVWAAAVRTKKAPPAVRKVGGRNVWRAEEARRAVIEEQPPDAWDASQCAAYASMSTRAWRAAVRSGDAPQPIARRKSAARLWDIEDVKRWADSRR